MNVDKSLNTNRFSSIRLQIKFFEKITFKVEDKESYHETGHYRSKTFVIGP